MSDVGKVDIEQTRSQITEFYEGLQGLFNKGHRAPMHGDRRSTLSRSRRSMRSRRTGVSWVTSAVRAPSKSVVE